MKKTVLLVILLTVVSVFLLTGCAGSGKNLLAIGSEGKFEYTDLAAAGADWSFKTDAAYSVSDAFSVSDNALVINTTKTGWVQASQSVKLQSNSYYLVEYTFTANTFNTFTEKGFDGFFISILEDEDFNYGAENTSRVEHRAMTTNKTTAQLYFKTTGAKKTTFTINVGTEDAPVSVNSVTISSMKLTKVSKSDVKAAGASYQTFKSDHYNEVSSKNVYYVVFGVIAILALGYAAYVMVQRNMAMGEGSLNKFFGRLRDSKWLGLILTVSIAVFIRLLASVLMTVLAGGKTYFTMGYQVEGSAAQALFMGNYGTAYLGKSLYTFCTDNSYTFMPLDGTPLNLYLLALIGLISRIFGDNSYLAATFFIKFFMILADIGTAILIYQMVKKSVGNVGATVIATMFMLLPITFGMSSIWGIMESMTVFLLVLTFYFILKNNYFAVAGVYFAACMFSWTAAIIAPIIIFYSVQQFINQKKLRIPMIATAVGALGLFYLITLPFYITNIQNGTPFIAVTNYWGLLFGNIIYTNNAFNFQALLGNNMGKVTTGSLIVSIIFIIFIVTMAALGYFRNKNRMDLLLLATAYINMMFMFSNNMTPTVMTLSLALMLIYAIMNKEKRVYFTFIFLAAFNFVNIAAPELFFAYASDSAQMIPANHALMYVFGALNLLMVLYYLYVTYDIVASKKIRKINPMTLTYGQWWKNIFLKMKKAYYKLRIRSAKQA